MPLVLGAAEGVVGDRHSCMWTLKEIGTLVARTMLGIASRRSILGVIGIDKEFRPFQAFRALVKSPSVLNPLPRSGPLKDHLYCIVRALITFESKTLSLVAVDMDSGQSSPENPDVQFIPTSDNHIPATAFYVGPVHSLAIIDSMDIIASE